MTGSAFSGAHAAGYAAGPPRQVPGYSGLLRMTALLLAERVPADGRLLVLGAGGGLELKALAEFAGGWRFAGVDPSADMLRLAAETAAAYATRIHLHEGTIDTAPEGPFDGATSILVFHFIPRDQRLATLAGLRRRLKRGAPLVLAHISAPAGEAERSQWLARHVAFGAADGTDPARLDAARQTIASRLAILAPEEEEAMLAEAGFTGTSLFYAGFAVRGWVAYA